MADMGDGYGSECHLLRYLGRHRKRLDAAVHDATGGQSIDWLDAPFDASRRWPDGEWTGLDFLPADLPARRAWTRFWPSRGNPPNWDAVGQLRTNGQTEWLLVEAKAHVREVKSACQAKPEGGRGQITAAFEQTKQALGVASDRDWLTAYYQYCNRAAILNFLTQQGVPARLLFVYFLGDRSGPGRICPAQEEAWAPALAARDRQVGLPVGHRLTDRIHKVFLPVCPVGPAEGRTL
jgi:hypothetical protein